MLGAREVFVCMHGRSAGAEYAMDVLHTGPQPTKASGPRSGRENLNLCLFGRSYLYATRASRHADMCMHVVGMCCIHHLI